MSRFQKWGLAFGMALVIGLVCQGQVGAPPGVNPDAGPPRVISGTVFDASGAPAPGVALMVVGPVSGPRAQITSDARGKYSLVWRALLRIGNVAPVNPVYSLVARDFEHNFAAAREFGETTTNLDLHLQPALTIFGKVEDADGKPITNATAGFDIFSGTTGNAFLSPPMTADDPGRVQIPALPQGGRYSVWFRAPGYATSFPSTQIEEAETHTNRIDLPTVVLKAGGGGRISSSQAMIVRALATSARTITGTVFDPSGGPAPGVSLMVVPPATAPNVPIQSDANGRYTIKWASRFDSNTVHVFSLIARDLRRELAAAHTIDETTTNLDLHLQPGLTIATAAQDPNGKPITNATASLVFYSGNTEAPISESPISSDGKGVIRFTALPQGCRYRCGHPDWEDRGHRGNDSSEQWRGCKGAGDDHWNGL